MKQYLKIITVFIAFFLLGAAVAPGPLPGGGGTTITGAASTVTTANLTANKPVISNSSGKLAIATGTCNSSTYVKGDGSCAALSGAITGTFSAGQVLFGSTSSNASGENALYYDSTTDRLGIGTSGSVNDKLEIRIADAASGGVSITTPTYTSGFGINLGTGGEGYLFHNGAAPIYFMTSATTRGVLTSAGQWNFGSGADPGANKALITNTTASDVALAVKGASSQSAHLQDWKNSSNAVLASVSASGAADFASMTLGTPLTVSQGGTGLSAITAYYLPIGNGTSAPTLLAPGASGYVLTSNGASANPSWQAAAGGVIPGNCNLRLTLVSGQAVMDSDQLAKTNVYATPFEGANCSLYDGSVSWSSVAFSETTLSLAGLTANTNYDVFAYNNSGTLALESLSWSSSSARATALVLQNGVWVKSGATTRRYLGTFRTTGTTGQTQFSGFTGAQAAGGTEAKMFLYNAQNKKRFTAYARDSTDSWTHAATWRNADNSATMRVSYITGLADQDLVATYSCLAAGGTTTAVGVGVNSSSNYTGDSGVEGAITSTIRGTWRGQSAIGLNYVQALEYSSGTGTFYGDAGGSATQNTLIFTGDF